MRECFFGSHSVPATHDNVLGVLSLIIYSLLLVISIKYIAIVMRADNQGEGGILALTALLPQGRAGGMWLVFLGIFGASLLYGDGMITPAITVLGAVEGLKVATPLFDAYVVPIAVVILIGVFAIQRHGTHRVGRLFGPIMVAWFVVIAVLGIVSLVRQPVVLTAVDPRHAFSFFREHGWHGFAVLGAVFLVVTGGEALYADMGHFGKRPIRVAWFTLVLPALLLNYFGQGALLLVNPAAAEQPFFLLAPGWALLPLVVLATAAAIIASQALISGAFSLTQQAVQLGYCPRLGIEHTSHHEIGQVYVPQVNWALMLSTILIVIGFESSTALAAAYGIAVTLTMVITAVLLQVVAIERWGWSPVRRLRRHGGIPDDRPGLLRRECAEDYPWRLAASRDWRPALHADDHVEDGTPDCGRPADRARVVDRGLSPPRRGLAARARSGHRRLHDRPATRHSAGAGPQSALQQGAPRARHHAHGDDSARPARAARPAGRGALAGPRRVRRQIRYGFMDEPNVPEALAHAREQGLGLDEDDVTYFLGRETLIVTEAPGMARWREQLFVLMARNAVRATTYFRLPPERVVELGVQVEI